MLGTGRLLPPERGPQRRDFAARRFDATYGRARIRYARERHLVLVL
jgi:hypothetical protein